MTINNNSVEQINVALLDMDKKLKSAASKSASASDFKNLEASVDNIKRTLNETKTGLEPGKTYDINISGNAATADKAKEAERNKLVNALTVNGETYDGSEAVDAGVQKIENGGTGVTTQADINKAFIGNLETGSSDVTDGTEFVSSYASDNGFAETAEGALNKPYKRQFVKVWNYIKGKISSVLGLTKDNYGGKAATADKATTATTAETATKVSNALTVNGKTYNGSEGVDAGVQTVANGGTGVTTQADINKAFISNLDVGTSDVTDGTEFVSSYASDSGFSSTDEGSLNTPYKRQFIKVWNYIKGKISSVLGLTKDNYGGKASTAGNADTVDNYHASQLWRSDGATWNPNANISLGATANGDEWSFDISRNGKTGCYWHVWDSAYGSLLKVNADNGKVYAPYGFVGNLSGKADTAETAIKANNAVTAEIATTAETATIATIAETADSAKNMYYQNLDLSSLDKTKFYPLVCYSAINFVEVAICSESGMGSAEYNQNRIHFDISTMGWSDLPPTLNIREYACYDNNEITIGCIGRGVHNGAWAIWLRGGIHYTCFSRDADLSLHTSNYTFGDETYTVGTNYYGGSNTNVEVWFTPQSTITEGAYSSRPITAPRIKADYRMVIPIGAPSSLEDGCIWIEADR